MVLIVFFLIPLVGPLLGVDQRISFVPFPLRCIVHSLLIEVNRTQTLPWYMSYHDAKKIILLLQIDQVLLQLLHPIYLSINMIAISQLGLSISSTVRSFEYGIISQVVTSEF